jgi:bidirectional [NiFe] hydrogenase diaphorase subunit
MNPEELLELATEEREKQAAFTHNLRVCVAAGCLSTGSDKVKEALAKEVEARGLKATCQVKGVGCLGLCSVGPLINVDGAYYRNVTPEDAADIIERLGAEPLERLHIPSSMPFFARQQKVVLENSGVIDPERLEEYAAADGYEGLVHALTEMTPPEVINEITKSGLRGRGGGGYPTGLKWSTVAKAASEGQKYVICNADEGDPGAFMDRSVLESDPHRVLEGMAIAGYAVGADRGFIYVRAEYPLAIQRLRTAIRQAERAGLLGREIAGTTFNFSISVRLGAGAFVCGEETALMASIEGKRGQPRPRPPYPAESGLYDKPTLINNVETFANVPPIIRKGSAWFARIGTEKSKGTKVFALAGDIQNTGLVEVPMGVTLRDVVFDIGGGVPGGEHFKAVQTGGPSGGCIPADYLDNPVDYESLTKLGSIMGSGGMIVMSESACMVDVAKYFMEFCMSESCGKCIPCRVGTAQMYGLLSRITKGIATPADLQLLEDLSEMVRSTSLCGLGQSAPNPVLSTLRYFRHEYEAHIEQHTCPSHKCQMVTDSDPKGEVS